jgi:hypothetical protein
MAESIAPRLSADSSIVGVPIVLNEGIISPESLFNISNNFCIHVSNLYLKLI